MNINKIKEDLKSEYKYRIELHAHSKPVSPCSEIPPEQLIKVYKDLGFDAIALTNHLIIYKYRIFSFNRLSDSIKWHRKVSNCRTSVRLLDDCTLAVPFLYTPFHKLQDGTATEQNSKRGKR